MLTKLLFKWVKDVASEHQIPFLHADKVDRGTFHEDRIPVIDINDKTSEVLDGDRLPLAQLNGKAGAFKYTYDATNKALHIETDNG